MAGLQDQHWKRAIRLYFLDDVVSRNMGSQVNEPQSGEMEEMQVRKRKWKEMQVGTLKTCLVGCAGEVGRWQGCEQAQPTHTRTCGFPRQNCSQLFAMTSGKFSRSDFQLFHPFLFCSNGFALCLSFLYTQNLISVAIILQKAIHLIWLKDKTTHVAPPSS